MRREWGVMRSLLSPHRKPSFTFQEGYTLMEIFVILAVFGLLLSLAMVRYLGMRREAIIAEADYVLAELKNLGRGQYQQYPHLGWFDSHEYGCGPWVRAS